MGRAPCCDKANVKKGPWSPEEDAKLKDFIHKHGPASNWIALPQKAGLRRCGKSCRLRWLNYLRPNIKHGHFSHEEDTIISTLYANIGSRWSIIASQLPGRTDNDIKNYWNTKLKKKIYGVIQPPLFPSPPSHSLSSFYHHQPPNPLNNPPYSHPIKDNMLVFGGNEAAAAPSSSSSSGSYHETGAFQGFVENRRSFAFEDPLGSILDHHHQQLRNGVLEESQFHYDLTSGGAAAGGGGGLMFGDENRGGEMEGMYYF